MMKRPDPKSIRDTRRAAKLTQQKAAELLGVCERTWRHWESGAFSMRPAMFEAFQSRIKRL